MHHLSRAAVISVLLLIIAAGSRAEPSTPPAGPGAVSMAPGQPVTLSDGSRVGRVENLIVDSGRVTGAVVELETLLGRAIRRVQVPIERMQPAGDGVVIGMTRTQIAALPNYP